MLRRDFLLSVVATFFLFLAVSALFLLPRQLVGLGASDAEIGLVMGSMQVATLVAMPLVGTWLHRVGARGFMIRGAALMCATCVALSQTGSLSWVLVLVRLVQGLGFAMFFVSVGALVVEVTPESRRAQGLALWGVAVLVTQALAPCLSERLLETRSFSDLWRAAAGACAVAAVSSLLLTRTAPPGGVPSPLTRLLRLRPVALAEVAVMSSGIGFGSIISFLAAYTERIEIGTVAPFFGAYFASSVLVRVFGGSLADRGDRRRVVIPSLVAAGAAVAGLSLVSSGLHLATVGLVFGAGHGLSYPTLMAFVVDQARPIDQPRVVALNNWSFTVGMLAGSIGFGPLSGLVGTRAAYAAVGAIGLAAAALLALSGKPAARAA
jgi:MFS family permease